MFTIVSEDNKVFCEQEFCKNYKQFNWRLGDLETWRLSN